MRSTNTDINERGSGNPVRRLSWCKEVRPVQIHLTGIPLHENRFILRCLHLHIPELVKELLVAGD